MADSKIKIKQINPKNELIKSLPDVDYIQNPIIYSQICGNFTLMQTNIMFALIESIRTRITGSIVDGKGIASPLFTRDEVKGKVNFRIPLTSLGVDSNQYPDVEVAGRAILDTKSSYRYVSEEGERRYRVENIFSAFDMPDQLDKNGKTRRKGYIELSMDGDVVDRIFNGSNQYVEHMKDIAKISRSPRTPRLYVYLAAWRKTRGEVLLNYDAVKEYLGMLEYSKDHSRVLNDKCKTYALFHRDVIDPAKKELKKLAEQGKVEFYFDYEPVYKNGKKRGNPDQLRFFLIASPAYTEVEAIEVKLESPSEKLYRETQERVARNEQGRGGLYVYAADLKAAWEGDEQKRQQYPNWERDYPRYAHLVNEAK